MKAPPADAPEWQIQSYIVQEMAKLGLYVAEINYTTGKPQGTKTTEGFPDLAVIGRGKCHLWECKTLKGTLTGSQEIFHAKCREVGYYIPIVRSLDDAIDLWNVQWGRR